MRAVKLPTFLVDVVSFETSTSRFSCNFAIAVLM